MTDSGRSKPCGSRISAPILERVRRSSMTGMIGRVLARMLRPIVWTNGVTRWSDVGSTSAKDCSRGSCRSSAGCPDHGLRSALGVWKAGIPAAQAAPNGLSGSRQQGQPDSELRLGCAENQPGTGWQPDPLENQGPALRRRVSDEKAEQMFSRQRTGTSGCGHCPGEGLHGAHEPFRRPYASGPLAVPAKLPVATLHGTTPQHVAVHVATIHVGGADRPGQAVHLAQG